MTDHHSGLVAEDVAAALMDALDKYERGDCDCCLPNPTSEVYDHLGIFWDENGELADDSDMTLAARLHRFAIGLAYATTPKVAAAALHGERQRAPEPRKGPSDG